MSKKKKNVVKMKTKNQMDNELKQQIEKVAEYKDWKLVNKYAN